MSIFVKIWVDKMLNNCSIIYNSIYSGVQSTVIKMHDSAALSCRSLVENVYNLIKFPLTPMFLVISVVDCEIYISIFFSYLLLF